ncbi:MULTISPECIES: type II toxin-antitoxin system prevent-host-death family antitoxin [unclassified Mesorhizobium]|uniref:type II toxin-antitoxin system Phd/YefM family antitoxin n=1 Tax=unclassified Mesorhizobium TaxID=325217 RepID=UPI0003CF9454|nr:MULTISPECIES: type II toxin-antitoxin system prevent-host-death family antitoxin [unclassified Mesorhizobium]ESX17441.1 prevent-host-death protein [Mesorhizobium sp. LSJC264A00]ESY09402.1 prevent-host-death protein [Mesorhizobium sp. LNJC398B00]ESY32038.1 prevent-host-death protein [Mesorhizobium sp. LNJC386A00]ESZ48671.1 prevent-host-death protein [Mesorhizobium sp. L2C054A000]ESZ62666.1 prevent-host-death protein [Mesorhizobium sp. L103C131B0]
MNVSITEAKAKLSELVGRAEAGEEIVITRHGKIAARLVAPVREDLLSRIGALKGKIWISDDFDKLGPEWNEYTR